MITLTRQKLAALNRDAENLCKNLLMIKHLIGEMEKNLASHDDEMKAAKVKFCGESETLLADIAQYVERDMYPEQSSEPQSEYYYTSEDYEFYYDVPCTSIEPSVVPGPKERPCSSKLACSVLAEEYVVPETKKPWSKPLEWKQPSWMSKKQASAEDYLIEVLKSQTDPASLPSIKLELKKREVPKEIIKQISGPGNLYKLLKTIPGIQESSVKSNPFFKL